MLRRALALVVVALAAAGCSGGAVVPPTTSSTVTTQTSPPGHPIPVVDVSATPAGWVPVDYGDTQVSVPTTYDVLYSTDAPCQIEMPPGDLFVAAPIAFATCEAARTYYEFPTAVRMVSSSASPGPGWRHQIVNGIAVFQSPAPMPIRDDLTRSATVYLVPSLGTELTVGGPSGHRILETLTRSPRTVALASGPAPSVPTAWHTVAFETLSFSVPKSWPVTRTSQGQGIGNICGTPAVALFGPRVLLSTDLRLQVLVCPVTLPRPQSPQDGVQVDAGSHLELPRGLAFSTDCLDLHGLTACPAMTPAYSILIMKIAVPLGHMAVESLLVSIGLAGNGMTARTILHSLRAA